jgi:hypothetical protein
MKLAFAAALFAAGAFAQPSMPEWLKPFPGATPTTKTFSAFVESTLTTSADSAAVTEHYRKLFETANLPFVANADGVGVNVRGAASECDLLLSIRPQPQGTLVRISCAAKSPSYTSVGSTEVATSTPSRAGASRRSLPSMPSPPPRMSATDIAERHQQRVAELGIHPVYQDAPAPPLVWPDWLVHFRGAKLSIERGVDQSHRDYLRARFTSSAPMTEIYTFYEDLLKANAYPVHSSKLGTGQTMSGVSQNADGNVEGANYPNGHPGPWSEIRVSFSRFYLNEPIKVEIRFTTYDFKAGGR